MLFCLEHVHRDAGVLVFSYLANLIRVDPLSKVDQFIMAYGGLRGAIAFSLVVLLKEDLFPNKKLFMTTTIVVIYFTVFVQGATIKPLVNFLKVKRDLKRKPNMNERIHNRMIDHLMGGIEDIAGHVGHHVIREKFQHISKMYLKPALLRKGHMGRGRSIMNVYQKLAEQEMRELVHSSSYTVLSQMQVTPGSTPSMAQFFAKRSNSKIKLDETDGIAHELSDGDTCLDIASLDAQSSRKMRDDSKSHHISDDVLFKPKRRHSHAPTRHMLPSQPGEESGHLVDFYKTRPLLRHRYGKSRHSEHAVSVDPTKQSKRVKVLNGDEPEMSKPRKNVNFAAGDDAKDGKPSDEEDEDTINLSGSDDEGGITFSVDVKARTPVEAAESNGVTSAERSLPWKRNTGREPVSALRMHSMYSNEPAIGEAPPWVEAGIPEPIPTVELAEVQVMAPPDGCSVHDTMWPNRSKEAERNNSLGKDAYEEIELKEAPSEYDEGTSSQLPWQRDSDETSEPVLAHDMYETEDLNVVSVPSPLHDSCDDIDGAASDADERVEVIPPLPWRQNSDEPPTSLMHELDSMCPQLSSMNSFMLSEAESKHSEPMQIPSVMDMPHMIDTNGNGDFLLDDLETDQMDFYSRVAQWLLDSVPDLLDHVLDEGAGASSMPPSHDCATPTSITVGCITEGAVDV